MTLPDRAEVVFDVGPRQVVRVLEGVRVGVLFVRPACWDEATLHGEHALAGYWVIDVPAQASIIVGVAHDFWNALLIADEVSRYALLGVERLLTVRTPDDVELVLGQRLIRWCSYVDRTDDCGRRALAFRPWCERLGLGAPLAAAVLS